MFMFPPIFNPSTWGFTTAYSGLPDGTSGYLTRTTGAGSRRIFSYGGWFKRTKVGGGYMRPFGVSANDYVQWSTDGSNDKLEIVVAGTNLGIGTSEPRELRDTTGWFLFMVAVDTTQATAADRVKVYINDDEVAVNTQPAQNADSDFLNSTTIYMMRNYSAANYYGRDYCSNLFVVDGTQLTPANVMDTSDAGRPLVDLTGITWGTEGAWIQDPSTGTDTSGNGNNFTKTGTITQSTDVPTDFKDGSQGNEAVFNPLDASLYSPGLTNGNRSITGIASSFYRGRRLTLNPNSTAKVYVEFKNTQTWAGGLDNIGLYPSSASGDAGSALGGFVWQSGNGVYYVATVNTGTASTGAFDSTNIVGIAYDPNTSEVWVHEEGTWVGDPAAGTGGIDISSVDDGTLSFFASVYRTNSTIEVIPGDAAQTYRPAGFVSLNTANLTKSTNALSNLLVITDPTTTETNIASTLATARAAFTNYVDIFVNRDASEARLWRFSHDSSNAHAQGATNTHAAFPALSGSNKWSGYSIKIDSALGTAAGAQAHTNGVASTITHNLGSTDVSILLFSRAAASEVYWYHPALTSGNLMILSSTDAQAASTIITNITSNSFDIGSSAATETYDYLVFIGGELISIGTHEGNANADGPHLYTGGKPAFWLHANSDAGAIGRFLWDEERSPTNEADRYHFMDEATTEGSGFNEVDFLAYGIKIRNALTSNNASANTIIWLTINHPPPAGSGQSRAK